MNKEITISNNRFMQFDRNYVPTYADIKQLEYAVLAVGHPGDEYPVIHEFADNIYSREVTMVKGMILVGRMHAVNHFFTLLSGEVTAWTEEGMRRMKAPQTFKTKAGTKRVIFAHEESRIKTYHGTQNTTVEAVEAELFVPEPDEQAFLIALKIKQLGCLEDGILEGVAKQLRQEPIT